MNHQRSFSLLRSTVLIFACLTIVYLYFLERRHPKESGTLALVNDSFTTAVHSKRGSWKTEFLTYTYKVLDAELCGIALEFPERTKVDRFDSDKCPKSGIVTVVTGGRTANQIWEYASVWTAARFTGLDPYVPSCIKRHLESIFANLSLGDLTGIADCPVQSEAFVMSTKHWSNKNQSIILPRYANDERALAWTNDLRTEFKFKKELTDKAQETLQGFLKKMRPNREYTFIGVHVRRTDYIQYIKTNFGEDQQPASPEFYTKAMRFYKEKFPNCLFVFVSDEPVWCRKQFGHLKDVVIPSGNNTAGEDLALLAACNHSVFDYGTFGEWGAILAGGITVYSNLSQNSKKGKLMEEWIMM